ncbi:MAG: SPW repeat protein, partial [Candidatus Kryptoniota bacterium]
WDAIIIGIAIVILAGWAALSSQINTAKTLSWINTVLGIWLIIAPFIIRYSNVGSALWNDIIVGIAVAVLSVWAANIKTVSSKTV